MASCWSLPLTLHDLIGQLLYILDSVLYLFAFYLRKAKEEDLDVCYEHLMNFVSF